MTIPKYILSGLIVLFILTGAGLRLYQLGQENFSSHEAPAAAVAQLHSITQGLSLYKEHSNANSLLLFPAVVYVWSRMAGGAEFGLRLLSVLIGVLTIGIVYYTCRVFLAGSVSLLIMLFFAVSPYHINISRELTPFSLVCLLSIINIFAWLKIRKTGPTLLQQLTYVVSGIALMMTHQLAFIFLAAQGALHWSCPGFFPKKLWLRLNIGAVVGYVVSIIFFTSDPLLQSVAVSSPIHIFFTPVHAVSQMFFLGGTDLGKVGSLAVTVILYSALFCSFLHLFGFKRKNRMLLFSIDNIARALIVMSALLFFMTVYFFSLLIDKPLISEHTVVFIFFPCVVLIVSGLYRIRMKIIPSTLMIAVFAMNLWTLCMYYRTPHTPPYHQAIQFISQQIGMSDRLVCADKSAALLAAIYGADRSRIVSIEDSISQLHLESFAGADGSSWIFAANQTSAQRILNMLGESEEIMYRKEGRTETGEFLGVYQVGFK